MMKTSDVRSSAPMAMPVTPSTAGPSATHTSLSRAACLDALTECASHDELGRVLARAVTERAQVIARPASPGGAILARTILDKRSPVAAWKAATSSTFASRRGRNQPTLLVV